MSKLLHPLFIVFILSICTVMDSFTPRSYTLSNMKIYSSSIFAEEEGLRGIAEKYLLSKYKGCVAGVCRFACDRQEISEVLRTVLPPLSSAELDKEIDITMKKFGSDETIPESDFLAALIDNSYWNRAGSLVVKELIYLDCLQSFYSLREKILDDDDYDALKEMLVWEGSSAATLSSKEARFISGVAAYRRGVPIMGDKEYEALKSELSGSWVTKRMQDPLEKMGMDTFLGYLHKQMLDE